MNNKVLCLGLTIGSLFLFSLVTPAVCQEVVVSSDINVRNDYAYHLIGRVDNTILLYQDKGADKKLLVFNENLELQSERFLKQENKRVIVYDLANIDTAFCLFYGVREKEDVFVKMNVFSKTAELLDSIVISKHEKQWGALDYETVFSEDNSKIAFYNISGDQQLKLIVFDIFRKESLLDQDYIIKNGNLVADFKQVVLGNNGAFFLMIEKENNRTNRDNHEVSIYEFLLSSLGANEIVIPLNGVVSSDIRMAYNNGTNEIGVAGLYDEKRSNESSGYFWLSGSPRHFDNTLVNLTPFDEALFFELYGERGNKRLESFSLSEILWKGDGSPVLIFEKTTDQTRRSGGSSFYNGGYSNYGGYYGWSDHYREDLVVISLLPSGKKHWHQVFYKKQFSQNDGAIYSSFFPFITPSRIRLIYNDEIKNNSTVSEYIFDGLGNFKRSSVLSTEYQDLRLRFTGAIQLSSTELLVPSQKNYALNLVKIDFSK